MIDAADIAVYDEFGQVLLLAEVKTPPSGTTPEWAAEVRQDVGDLLGGFVPRYFLVVARDFGYLWTTPATVESLPDVRIPTDELLGEYFRGTQLTARTIPPSALELAVGIWLRDLTRGAREAARVLPPRLDLAMAAENGRIHFASAA
jgi:hypothetical protein